MKTDLVVAGYLVHKGKVLLVHHRKLDLWLPVGGHIDENETPDEALKREFREETNLDIEIVDKNRIRFTDVVKQLALPINVQVHSVGDHDHCCFFYACRLKNPENLVLDKNELKDFAWFSKEELEQDFIPPDVRHGALKAFDVFR